MTEFLNMGGYAAYVWSAFGLSVLVLIGNAVITRRSFNAVHRNVLRRVSARQSESGRSQ